MPARQLPHFVRMQTASGYRAKDNIAAMDRGPCSPYAAWFANLSPAERLFSRASPYNLARALGCDYAGGGFIKSTAGKLHPGRRLLPRLARMAGLCPEFVANVDGWNPDRWRDEREGRPIQV